MALHELWMKFASAAVDANVTVVREVRKMIDKRKVAAAAIINDTCLFRYRSPQWSWRWLNRDEITMDKVGLIL